MQRLKRILIATVALIAFAAAPLATLAAQDEGQRQITQRLQEQKLKLVAAEKAQGAERDTMLGGKGRVSADKGSRCTHRMGGSTRRLDAALRLGRRRLGPARQTKAMDFADHGIASHATKFSSDRASRETLGPELL
jgi:hypothetical protein